MRLFSSWTRRDFFRTGVLGSLLAPLAGTPPGAVNQSFQGISS
jgi:hypothetical protein